MDKRSRMINLAHSTNAAMTPKNLHKVVCATETAVNHAEMCCQWHALAIQSESVCLSCLLQFGQIWRGLKSVG